MKGLSKTPSGSNGDGSKSDSMASGVGAPPDAATARPSVSSSDFESSPDKVPTAAIRNTLRALASEGGPLAGQRAVELVRPLVKRAHKVLRERFEAGGSVEAYLHDRTRLADTTIVGLLHVASVSSGMRREGSMIAPLAAVAVGGYGRGELAPGSDLDVLFLLPESGAPAAATVTCLRTVVTGLWDLGFTLDHSARSCTECLALAQDEPIVLASLLTRRFLWGGFSLYATLDAGVADLFSGPRASRWRGVVGSAMASRRNALDEPQAESEPNVKRGPGGLRDLQRVLAMNALPSGLAATLAEPALVKAHHFLWHVRCHLHLLAGRAEDHLSSAFQADVARRLGCERCGATAARPLLPIFRSHAHNVLRAAPGTGTARR